MVTVKNKPLAVILFLTFLLSFSYAIYYRIQPKVDARAYDTIAENIVSGRGYLEGNSADINYDNAIARVGPLYEYFLAGIYKLFGHQFLPVWFLQAILRLLSALLLYKTALIIFKTRADKERLALFVAAIFGFYPDLIEIGAMLMTETLYIFLFVLMLWSFFKFMNGQDGNHVFPLTDTRGIRSKHGFRLAGQAVLLGLISGLATLARPPVLFCLPVIFFYFYSKKLFRQMLWFCLMLALVLTPWTVRNYNVYGRVLPFGVVGQLNFLVGNHPGSRGEQESNAEIDAISKNYPAGQLGQEYMARFESFVVANPSEFVKLTAFRINKYFSIIRPMGFWFYTSGWRQMIFVALSALASIFLFIFGLAGSIQMFAQGGQNENYRYLLAFIILTPLILFVTVVETRYRFQIYPLLAISAAYFIGNFSASGGEIKSSAVKKILLTSAAIILLNGGADLLMSASRILERLTSWR